MNSFNLKIPFYRDGAVVALLEFDLGFGIQVELRPSPPVIQDIIFTAGVGSMAKAQLVLSPAAGNVAHRNATITVGGNAPITLDYIDPNLTFDCNPGDTIKATVTDVSNSGLGSPASDEFTKQVPTGGGGGTTDPDPPVKPQIMDIVFS